MMRGWSIRLKLTLWYTGVLAFMLMVFAAVVYMMMREHLMNRIDAGLREELSDVLGEVERATKRERMLYWLNRRFADHKGFDFQVTDDEGMRIFTNPRLGERRLPIPSGLPMNRSVYTVAPSGGADDNERRQRIITRKVAGPEGVLVVQVARSLDSYDHEMNELFWVLLVTTPTTLVVALGGGYWLASRALAPVESMTNAANEITVQRLDRRLETPNLDDELGRLGATLNSMIERLERSFHEIRRFTADASHELRTPISVIRTEAEVALSRPGSEADRQNLLSNILEECEQLTHITDQLLVLSREDAGVTPQSRERLDLTSLVKEVAETMRPLAETKRQQLLIRASGGAPVMGDPARLRQVFYNLLDNAIKYTPAEGGISVSIGTDSKLAAVTIRDSGIGIPAEHLPRVFDRFYRVDKARSRSEGGSGLGLSIVETIVKAHSGTVSLDSHPEKGTTCTVSLPCCQADA